MIRRKALRSRTSGPLDNLAAADPAAVLWDAGLGTVGKHGHGSPTSNLSASPRSGGACATPTPCPRSGGAGATKVSGPPSPAPCGRRGRRVRTSSRACSTPTRTSWPTSSPPLAGTCSRIVSSRTSSSGTPGCSSRRTRQGSFARGCIRWR